MTEEDINNNTEGSIDGTDVLLPEHGEPPAEEALVAALIDSNGDGAMTDFLDSLGLASTAEEIQAQSDAREVARTYDVATGLVQVKISNAVLRKQVETHLAEIVTFLSAEYNAAVLNGDEETQQQLKSAEGPRWYQLAVNDMQNAFMKLERSFTHPQGL